MFVQTQNTPNPNSLKFLPGKKVSNDTPIEITDKNKSNNELIRNILSINGVTGIFLSDDFLSVNKQEKIEWEDLKHIIISFINDYYSNGNEIVIDKKTIISSKLSLSDIEKNKISEEVSVYVLLINLLYDRCPLKILITSEVSETSNNLQHHSTQYHCILLNLTNINSLKHRISFFGLR